MENRIEWVDTAKTITMLLVIIGHCNYYYIMTSYGGVDYRTDIGHVSIACKILDHIVNFIYTFHMPLFMALSGMLFSFSMKKEVTFSNLLKNKILKNHFTSEILCDLGLTPVVSDSSGLDVLSMEALFSLNPDWIFVTSQGDEKKAIQSFEADFVSRPAWKNLKAVKNRQVVFLTKELYNYKPNELWAEAYAYLYTILYGTLDKSVFSSKRHL